MKLVVDTMMRYMDKEPTGAPPHRIHLHLCQAPVAVLGEGRVEGLRTERTELIGDGTVRGTGEFTDWPVQAVYRAVGYQSTHLADLPFDHHAGGGPARRGTGTRRGLDGGGRHLCHRLDQARPIGLIGHTKSDAAETVSSLLADLPGLRPPVVGDPPDAILAYLSGKGVDYTTWAEWERLDAHEIALGEQQGRERVKVVPREEMIRAGRG